MQTFKQTEIQVVYTFFMRLITEYIKTNPLNGMKNNQA